MATTKQLIQTLRQSTAPSSVTPDSLAGVFDSMLADINKVGAEVTPISTNIVKSLFD